MKTPLPSHPDLDTLNARVRDYDARHHFYHYQASALHLYFGHVLLLENTLADARAQFDRSVFQDHRNAYALYARGFTQHLLGGGDAGASDLRAAVQLLGALDIPYAQYVPHPKLPPYKEHPPLDSTYRESIHDFITKASILHDEAVSLIAANELMRALGKLDDALAREPDFSNAYSLRGSIWLQMGVPQKALENLALAVSTAQEKHDAYHKAASDVHLSRGQWFEANGATDLAIADYSKALDLHKNKVALTARAAAYRSKKNPRLAEADETTLKGW